MSAEALRQVMVELGFEVDLATIEKYEKRLKEAVKATGALPKANDKAATSAKKAGKAQSEAAGEAATAVKKASKPIESYVDLLKRVDDASAEAIGSKLGPHISDLAKRFPPLNRALERFGVDIKSNASIARVLVGATGAVVAVLRGATRAAFAFADEFSQVAEGLRDTARESRVTTTQLQELDHAAVQSGVGAERMRSGLATFGQSLRAAERWGNGTTFMLRRLGIQARDAGGHIRPTGDLMDEVAVAMEHIQSPTRRARVAVQLFGESGRRMLDVLHTGPGGIRALRDELAELGGGVTPEAVEASRQYTMATEKLSRAQDSLRSVLAVALLPVLSTIVTAGAKLGGLWARLTHGTHVVQIALAGLAVAAAAAALPIIIAWAPVALPFVVMAAKIALAVAVLDDLITFVEEGDSAIGRFIDSLFGVGTATQYVHELKEEWEAIVGSVERAIAAVARFTGLEAGQAQGTLRAPRLAPVAGSSARRIPAVRAIPTSAVTVSGGGGRSVAVPATRTVAAPGGSVSRTVVRQTTHAPSNVFHITNPDPRAAAAEAVRLLAQQERDRRDGDHPVDEADE